MSEPTSEQVLALPLEPNDAGAETIGHYLVQLLRELWRSGEGFSGKRPFGNSGWEWELYAPLVKAGFISGTVDEEGWVTDVPKESRKQAAVLIDVAIQRLWPSDE